MSPCVHLAKQRMVFGVFFLAPAGLAGNGSHEGSRSCVLQQRGLGSAVAAGGGVVTVPVLSVGWFPSCQLA